MSLQIDLNNNSVIFYWQQTLTQMVYTINVSAHSYIIV